MFDDDEKLEAAASAAGSKLRGALQKAGKTGFKISAKAGQALIKLLKALIAALGPIGIGILLAVIIFATLFSFMLNERGSERNYILSPDANVNNPMQQNEQGVMQAVALTPDNAYIDAYYKYLSLGSFQKYYESLGEDYLKLINLEDDTPITQQDIEDFAGLTDYDGKEQFFYLSSYFIQQAEEELHNDEFYYPEQVIKPVAHEIAGGRIRTSSLMDDDNNLIVESHLFDGNGTRLDSTATGVWDYGFGSILSYESGEVSKWIDADYHTIDIHMHHHWWSSHEETDIWYDKDGIKHEDTYTVYEEEESCISTPVQVDISGCTSVAEIKARIMACDEPKTSEGGHSWDTVEEYPNDKVLAAVVDSHNIVLPIDTADAFTAARQFNNSTLQAAFGNGKSQPMQASNIVDIKDKSIQSYLYPIKVALLNSAATMSGSISYTYTPTVIESNLLAGTGYCETDRNTDIEYSDGTCGGQLKLYRTGCVCEKKYTSTEDTDSFGYEYLDAYSANYTSFIPKGVSTEYDFKDRITDQSFKAIKDLGLIREYTGGPLAAVTVASDDEVHDLASFIALYTGESYFDRQMIAAVTYNRHKAGIESLSDLSGNIPSDEDKQIARQILSGTFSIPYNVCYFDSYSHGYDYCITESRTGSPRIFSSENIVSGNDAYGRPAKNSEQIHALSEGKVDVSLGYKELYEVFELNVLTTLAYAQKSAPQSTGSFLGDILAGFSDLIQAVKSAFSDAFTVFPRNSSLNTQKVFYEPENRLIELRKAVYQTIAFANKVTYSESSSVLEDSEDISFLFVGGNAGLGLGTSAFSMILVPGTATTISGFMSPTLSYYAPVSEYSDLSPAVAISAPKGTPILSVFDGVAVTAAGGKVTAEYEKNGQSIVLIYSGLETLNVSASQSLLKKQQLGLAGDSGYKLAVYIDGAQVNPYDYFYQSVYSTGAPLGDLLDADGNVDPDKIVILRAELENSNYCVGSNEANGVYDRWHGSGNDGIKWQCPWWARGRAWQYFESIGNTDGTSKLPRGNGGDTYAVAVSQGNYAVGQTPRANSLVCWSKTGGYGHVAYVEAVEKDGSFWISEAWGSQTITATTTRVPHLTKIGTDMSYGSSYRLEGFIYLDQPL